MNKKAIFGIALTDIVFFFMIVAVPLLIVYFLFLASVSEGIEEVASGIFPDLETQIYQNRLLYSDNCFAYSNNGRVYSGVLDPKKLTIERFRACLPLLTAQERGVEIILDLEDETKIFRTDNINELRPRSTIEINLVPVIIHGQGPATMRIKHVR